MAKNTTCANAPTAKILTAQINVLVLTCSFKNNFVCLKTNGKTKSVSSIVTGTNPSTTLKMIDAKAITISPTNRLIDAFFRDNELR